MNTVYGILGSLAIMACLAGWGSWEAGKVDRLQGQLDSRVAQEQTAAAQARLDAQQKEAADLVNLRSQSQQAIQSALTQSQQAQQKLVEYQNKIKMASGMKDLPHLCAGVQVPEDLRP